MTRFHPLSKCGLEMISKCLLFSLIAGCVLVQGSHHNSCSRVDTISRSIRDMYCEQPIFVNIAPRSDETQMFDNVCITLFPLPDDPSTFQAYASIVYCDGSFEVISYIATDISSGVQRAANPFGTITSSIFGYAGCDTYLSHVCANYGSKLDAIIGLSSNCSPIGLSCLRKIEEIISDHCLPDQEFYVLPMKLPNRCVTQQQCVAKTNNPFHKALGIAGPLYY